MAKICQKPLWMKRLVTIVQGLVRILAGCNPKKEKKNSRLIRVTINISRFIAIITHTATGREPLNIIASPLLHLVSSRAAE